MTPCQFVELYYRIYFYALWEVGIKIGSRHKVIAVAETSITLLYQVFIIICWQAKEGVKMNPEHLRHFPKRGFGNPFGHRSRENVRLYG